MKIESPPCCMATWSVRRYRPRSCGRRIPETLRSQVLRNAVPFLFALALILSIVPAKALEISVRRLNSDSFEFILTNGVAIGEREAQGYIANAATTVCKNEIPRLGKYAFHSKELLGGEHAGQNVDSFRFSQEVSCVPTAMTAPSIASSSGPLVVDEQKTRGEIASRTEHYFRLLSDDNIDDAYEEMSKTHRVWDEETWKREKKEFQLEAGKLRSITIAKITLYKNPPEAPEPGLYVAADYRNVYENVPIQCGYLIWFRTASGKIEITREEMGFATTRQLSRIPVEQIPALKEKLRCVVS